MNKESQGMDTYPEGKDLSKDKKNQQVKKKLNFSDNKSEEILTLSNFDLYMERSFPKLEKVFSENLDILEMHELLLKRFDFEKEVKPKLLIKEIEYQKYLLQTQELYIIQIKMILKRIDELRTEYQTIINQEKKNKYLNLTKELLVMYNQIGFKKKVISFHNKQIKKEDILNSGYRKKIIEMYLDIFKKFYPIYIIYRQNHKPTCPVCQLDLSKYVSEDEETNVICPKCNVEKTILIHTNIVSEVKYMNSKDGYEDRENFWKALQRFQGKQNNHIPERLFKELDEYFKSFGLPLGKDICNLELSKKGTRGNTSRSMMFKALSETNNSVFYEDVNLICHMYWGWLLPDISCDEDQIMNDYDMTQEVFKKIPKDRRSSLNAQYRLWQHLRIRGYRYPIDDFKIVKTPDILVEHDRIMKIMCEECNLPFIPAL
jgi:hypothetical protein